MTVTTIRPSGDGIQVGVSRVGGANSWSLLDDSAADDATYVFAASGIEYPAAYMDLTLPDNTPTIDANNRVLRVRIRGRFRLNAPDGGRFAHVSLNTIDARGGGGTLSEEFRTANSSSVVELTGVWRTKPTPNSGTEVNQIDLNNYKFRCNWWKSTGPVGANLRITELYLDVDVRVRGTVSGVTVTGHDLSTTPFVDWTFTPNADNDLQKKHRVKVFSSVQYGAAGFTPTQTDAVWDSGWRAGDSVRLQVGNGGTGAGLKVNTTYKAYVLAAQDFNGQDWEFASYVESSAFTVLAYPPPAPALTVVQDATVPKLRHVVTVQGLLNMLSVDDAGFEGGLGTWVALTNCSIVQSSTQAKSGAFSMRLSSTAGGDMAANTPGGIFGRPVKAGQSYTFMASFRAGATGRTCRVETDWYDIAGTPIGGTVNGSSVTDNTSNFNTTSTLTATAPAGAEYAHITVRVLATGGAAELHYVDEISMHPGLSTIWTPGGFVGKTAGVVEFAWATMTPKNLAHPQLYMGGDWFPRNTDGMYVTGTNSRVNYSLLEAYTGDGSFEWLVRDTSSLFYIGAQPPSAPTPWFPINTYALAALPTKTMVFSFYAKASTSFSTQIVLQAMDCEGNTVGSPTNGSGFSITTSWAQYQLAITVPADAVYVRPHLVNSGSVVDRKVYVDTIGWEIGSVATVVTPHGGGTTSVFTPLRGAEVDALIHLDSSGDQKQIVIDHEVPPGVIVTYRAYNSYFDSATQDRRDSNYSKYVQMFMDPPRNKTWVLKDVYQPINNMQLLVTDIKESLHEEVAQFFPLRPTSWQKWNQRPVILSGYVGGHDGTLLVECLTEDDWFRLQQLIHAPYPLFLVFPDYGARYVRLMARGWPRDAEARRWIRTLTLDFVEAERPERGIA